MSYKKARNINFIDLGEEGDTLSGEYPVTVLRPAAVKVFTEVFFRNDQRNLASLLGIKVDGDVARARNSRHYGQTRTLATQMMGTGVAKAEV